MSGKLEVRVVKATGLTGADVGGKSDPFVILDIGTMDTSKKKKKFVPREKKKKKKIKTKVKKSTLDPVWNEAFEFDVQNAATEFLEYIVVDWDRLTSNDVIGTGHPLPLSKLPQDYPLLWELPLKKKGVLYMTVKAVGFGTPPQQYKISVAETREMMKM